MKKFRIYCNKNPGFTNVLVGLIVIAINIVGIWPAKETSTPRIIYYPVINSSCIESSPLRNLVRLSGGTGY